MTKQKNPKIRFTEFTDAWEQRKLGEIAKMYQPITISQSDLIPDISGVPVFGANGYIGYYHKANHEKDQVTVSARGENTGVPSFVKGPVWITGNSMVINVEDNEKVDKYFLYSSLKSRSLKKYVTGGAQPQLTREVLNTIIKSFPSLPEQSAIGDFFRQLDTLLTLHQRKLDELKAFKSTMLSKMFPKHGQTIPEIRLAGFDGEWEYKRLNEVADFNPKGVVPEQFNYVDLESVVGTRLISYRAENKDYAPSRAQRLAQNGDIFYQTVRPYQKNNYLFLKDEDNWVFSTGYAQMRAKINNEFLFISIQRSDFVNEVLLNCTGTSYPAINSKDLSRLKISVPKMEEQKKIGSFFSHLDDLISSTQSKIEELETLKKKLLQEMFV